MNDFKPENEELIERAVLGVLLDKTMSVEEKREKAENYLQSNSVLLIEVGRRLVKELHV